ncbi:MAG: c-type cytochrome [Deltaproteobacteria bacterium]|nr:c-type cytochrome [Deltaproteobacteria bacterium]MDQ3297583.1 c-type cytochrome [Myxococcota bacterium]
MKPTEPAQPIEPAKPDEPAKPADEAPRPDPKAELLAAEMAAFDKAKPVFDKWCAKCHAEGGKAATKKKRDHFDMTRYPFGGHHAMEISKEIRKSLAIGGGKPTMPFDKKGAVKGDELAAIAAWADAFDASHTGGAHQGTAHDHGGGHKH